jgi:hypothetical protein
MVIGENVTVLRDKDAAAAHGLVAGRSEKRLLSRDCANDRHHRGAHVLDRLGDGRFDLGRVDDQCLLLDAGRNGLDLLRRFSQADRLVLADRLVHGYPAGYRAGQGGYPSDDEDHKNIKDALPRHFNLLKALLVQVLFETVKIRSCSILPR